MPKRTNDFQSLVALVEDQLADPTAQISESKLVVDTRNGEPREIDIYIEQPVGSRRLQIAIECIDHSRPATVEWIDRMIGKYRDLPIDKLIAVSRSGFTKSSREKAKASRIETLTLGQAMATDWARVLNREKRLRLSRLDLSDIRIGLLIRAESALALDDKNLGERVISKSDGSSARKLTDETIKWLADGHIQAQIQRELDKFKPKLKEPGQTCQVSVQLYYEDGMTVEDKQGLHHEIKALQLLLTFEYQPRRIPLELNAYGEALVASASFDLEESRVTYAIVETPGKAPTFGVAFRAKDGSGVIPTAVLGPMGHIDILLPRRSLNDQP